MGYERMLATRETFKDNLEQIFQNYRLCIEE
jgi:hypothetical protein